MENKYYVYALLDPRKPGSFKYENHTFQFEPFYIGKGTANRLNHHVYARNREISFKNNKIKKIFLKGLTPIALKVKDKLTENEALNFEAKLVDLIGLKIENKGPLTNINPGGLKVPLRTWSEEQKKEMSQIISKLLKGRLLTQEWKNKIKENNAKYWSGKHLSEETKEKLRNKHKLQDFSYRRNNYLIESPEGKIFSVNNIIDFCKKHNLMRAKMISLSTGKQKYYKGWKCIRLTNWREGYLQKKKV